MMYLLKLMLRGSVCSYLGILVSVSSCVHQPASNLESHGDQAVVKNPDSHGQPHPAVWFAGPVAAAFDEAAARKKLVFLYN